MTEAPVELWREARDQARADVLGDLDKLRRYETVQRRRDALDELEKLVRAGWRRDVDSREIMHEREVMQTRITELEAALRDAEQVGSERGERIRALADSVDEVEGELDQERTERAAEKSSLEAEAQRLADELACERERHQATLVVGLGLSDELRVFEDRVERLHLVQRNEIDLLERRIKAEGKHFEKLAGVLDLVDELADAMRADAKLAVWHVASWLMTFEREVKSEHDAELRVWMTSPSRTTHRLVPERARGAAEPVPLGPTKTGKACTWRPPADIVVGREDVPRGEQRSGYVTVERKEKR